MPTLIPAFFSVHPTNIIVKWSFFPSKIFYHWPLLVVACLLWAKSSTAPVLLLSLDGFRWDYPERFGAPHLTNLSRSGVRMTRGLKPTFATITYPAHHSIATGLYEESHGIVSNSMYDPVLNASFRRSSKDPKWWQGGGEPLWIWAQHHGIRTAAYFWPGSNFKFGNRTANIYKKYRPQIPYARRAETVMKWLTDHRIKLVMMYEREPDHTGHNVGPESQELAPAVEKADSLVGILVNSLTEYKLLDSVNFIVTADHGMATLVPGPDQMIVLSDYLDLHNNILKVPISGPIAHILPVPGKLEFVYSTLAKAHPKMKVYKKEDLPERYHYTKHRRILPLVAIAEEGYVIFKTRRYEPIRGQHGYSNELEDMRPIFYARGPDFRVNYTSSAEMHSLDIYPLVCRLLGIPAAPNNGSLERTLQLLRSD